MRIFILVLLFCFSCSKSKNGVPFSNTSVKDSLEYLDEAVVDSSKLVKVIYHHNNDNNHQGSYFDKEAYKAFGKWFNELNPNYVCAPDIAQEIFFKEGFYKQKSNPIRKIQAGPDFFYLYAHFLQKKNGKEVHVELREKALRIFALINAIYSNINFDGGIYFSHQRTAIAAYAEYAVYSNMPYKNVFEKKYSIRNQKSLYIQLLKQKVDDELNEMVETKSGQYWYLDSAEERKEWRKETLSLIDELDSLIETHYDLKIAQEFQNSHYQ